MSNITIFNNDLFGQVRSLIIDEKIYFVGKDIATALGYKNTRDAISRHCKGVVKHDILDITGVEQQMNIIPESDMYRLIFGSHLPEAEKFEEWVVEEVLPQLRKSGVYMMESATQEAINYEFKFGVNKIRKTFRETTNLEETWKEFKELAQIERKANRLTAKDTINRCNQIIDELNKFKANNIDMPYYKHALYDAMIIEALNEKQRLSNKLNGGIKSGKTKKINNLEHQNRELEEELNQWKEYAEELEEYYNPNREWITVDFAPFSLNCMYKDGRRTSAYNWWIKYFPRHQIPTREYFESKGIVFNPKSVIVELNFIHPERFDTDNLVKATIDMIFNRCLGVDDKVVAKVIPQTIGTCDSLEEGKIIFTMYNVDDDRI